MVQASVALLVAYAAARAMDVLVVLVSGVVVLEALPPGLFQ